MAATPSAPDQRAVEDGLARAKVPGATLGAVHHGEPIWVATYGARRRGGAPVEPSTVFQAASLSKPVAALGILRLADEGRLDLDADVRPLLRWDIPEHPLLGARTRVPPTTRLLLRHRAGIIGRGTTPNRGATGFLDAESGGGSHRIANTPGAKVPTLEQSWAGQGGRPPVMFTTEPATGYAYSGAGFLVLQHLVEQVAQQSFADYFARQVFPMLSANLSTFALHPPAHWELASGHDVEGDPLVGEREITPWAAAGGLFSTARDLTLMLTMILAEGATPNGRFLTQASARDMVTEGLGVFADRPATAAHTFRHTGDNGGFRTLLIGHPPSRSGVIVMTNGRSSSGSAVREELGSHIMRLLIR